MTGAEFFEMFEGLIRNIIREEVQASAGVVRARAQNPPPALLTREQLSKELMVSESQVDKLRKAGMPWVRVGDSPRFELAACMQYFKRMTGANDG